MVSISPSSADFSGEKRREELQGCSTSSWLFCLGSGNRNRRFVHGQNKGVEKINLFFEVGDLGHVQVEKKTHYINEPPPLNKPKTPPLNKEKPHSLILSIVRRPPLFHFWVSRAGRMAERGLGGGNQGWSFDSKILPKMDDLVVIYDDLHWFSDLAMIKWGMISDGRQIFEHPLEQMQGNWWTVAHLMDSLFWWHLFWETVKRGENSNWILKKHPWFWCRGYRRHSHWTFKHVWANLKRHSISKGLILGGSNY